LPSYPTFLADVTGDGRADLVFWFLDSTHGGALTIRTAVANGDGTFAPTVNSHLSDGWLPAYPTFLTDDTGDGRADFVFSFVDPAAGPLTIRTAVAKGDGTFAPTVDTKLSDGWLPSYPTSFADTTGDGKADFVFWFLDPTHGGA